MHKKAKVDRKIQQIIGWPSIRRFIKYIQNNNIPNLTFTLTDIKATYDIFVPDVGSIKGKTDVLKTKTVEVH